VTSPALETRETPDAIRPGSFAAWVLAARPRTLPVSLAPVLVGSAVAVHEGGAAWLPALAAAVGALLLQIGSNLANDVFDHEAGVDHEGRLGPPRAAQLGLLSPGALRAGMWLVFALACIVGLYLAARGGWPIVATGLVSIAAAIAYTGGPWPFGYHGLGDLAVFVFFGVVAVVGTTYVQGLELSALALAASVPVGCLATAILVVNNLRDVDTDAASGKRTLAVRLGRSGARAEYMALVALAYASLPVFWLGLGASVFVLLPLVSLPIALGNVRVVREAVDGPALNACLARTAQLVFLFSLLFSIGLGL